MKKSLPYERYMRNIRKMTPGTIGGQSRIASGVSGVLAAPTNVAAGATQTAGAGVVPPQGGRVPAGALPMHYGGSGASTGGTFLPPLGLPGVQTNGVIGGWLILIIESDVAPNDPGDGWMHTFTLGPSPTYPYPNVYIYERAFSTVNTVNVTFPSSVVSARGDVVYTYDLAVVQRTSGTLAGTLGTNFTANFDRVSSEQPSTFYVNIYYGGVGSPLEPPGWNQIFPGFYYQGDPPTTTWDPDTGLPILQQKFYAWTMHELVAPY